MTRDNLSARAPESKRPGDLIFLGRLVSEKGIDVLLHALALLRSRALSPRLTIVGSGPELSAMQEMAERLGLHEQVTFAGAKSGAELVHLLQEHKILVIPSRYDEPFGVVALEGIACGCVVSRVQRRRPSRSDRTVWRNLSEWRRRRRLEQVLERLLRSPEERERLAAKAPQHLKKFRPAVVAAAYLALFRAKLS